MKSLYKTLSLFTLAILLAGVAGASNPKKKLRRFLPKKATPSHIELVVGGYGEHAKRYGRKDHFNPFGGFMIGAKVHTTDGKVYGTAGIGGGIFSWDNFRVEVVGGRFDHKLFNRSNISISHPDQVPNHRIRLRVSFNGLPGTVREVELPLDFSYSYTLAEAGITGREGWEECRRAPSGRDGRDHEKCDGADGAHGMMGANGGIGQMGFTGPDIEVRLYPYDDLNSDDMVIEAQETNLRTGRTRTRWYKPSAGTLTVISRGGTGGSGGEGQPGGNGGDGGDGGREGDADTKPILADGGDGGNGGCGGRGGAGGQGGDGGQITVLFHPDLMNYLGSVEAYAPGGAGGAGGGGGKGGCAGDGGDGTRKDGAKGRDGGRGPCGLAGPAGFDGPPVRWIKMDAGA